MFFWDTVYIVPGLERNPGAYLNTRE